MGKFLDEIGLSELWRRIKERSLPVKYATQEEYNDLSEKDKKGKIYIVSTNSSPILQGTEIEEYDTTVDGCDWHVRKWSNGYCELLGRKTYFGLSLNNPWGETGCFTSVELNGPQFPFVLIEKYTELVEPDENHVGADKSCSSIIIPAATFHTYRLDRGRTFVFLRQTSVVDRSIDTFWQVTGRWK